MADSTNDQVYKTGEKAVTTSGTAVQVGSGFTFYGLSVTAKVGNTGQVYVGGNDVSTSTNDGLDAGDTLDLDFDGPVAIGGFYLDADTDGEGVDFYATLRR